MLASVSSDSTDDGADGDAVLSAGSGVAAIVVNRMVLSGQRTVWVPVVVNAISGGRRCPSRLLSYSTLTNAKTGLNEERDGNQGYK